MEDTWNLNMSAARSSIERCFGQLVLAWQIIKHGISAKDDSRARTVIRCVICLHNLRKRFQCPNLSLSTGTTRASCQSVNNLADEGLRNLAEARDWVTEHGLAAGEVGERLPGDRRASALLCSSIGSEVRQQLGRSLQEEGDTRQGVAPILSPQAAALNVEEAG